MNMSSFHFTEDEIEKELMNMGYYNLPPEAISQFKQDLIILMDQHTAQPDSDVINELDDSKSISSEFSCSERNDSLYNTTANTANRFKRFTKKVLTTSNTTSPVVSSSKQDSSIDESEVFVEVPFVKSKQIKRKICRKINETPRIDESLTDNSSLCESISQMELQGILSNIPSKSKSVSNYVRPPSSSSSLPSVIRPATSDSRYRNKCDPVKRFHEYKRYWNENAIPGEQSHKQLRWWVREQMFQYDQPPIRDICSSKDRTSSLIKAKTVSKQNQWSNEA